MGETRTVSIGRAQRWITPPCPHNEGQLRHHSPESAPGSGETGRRDREPKGGRVGGGRTDRGLKIRDVAVLFAELLGLFCGDAAGLEVDLVADNNKGEGFGVGRARLVEKIISPPVQVRERHRHRDVVDEQTAVRPAVERDTCGASGRPCGAERAGGGGGRGGGGLVSEG